MDGKLFAERLETGFDADITRRNVTKPVILFVAAEYCASNGIYLYLLYPNLTHITSTPKSSVEKKMSPKIIQVDGKWFELCPMRSELRGTP